jgi:ATP-dependent DNA helicase RecQ
MLEEGYILRTEGEYSVLRMGDITRLKEENASVLIRKPEEREQAAGKKKTVKKNTDALTSAGFKLFERLRQLRLAIAKEEAVPPYIIFSDKTLIDMCEKLPKNKPELLAVSGVGENKFRKYGQKFLDEIAEFGRSVQ